MNPLEWLKSAYEAFGVPHPKVSLAVVMVLGALTFAVFWQLAAKQVEKDQRRLTTQQPTQKTLNQSGPATVNGDNGIANTGSGNNFNSPKSTESKKKKGEH